MTGKTDVIKGRIEEATGVLSGNEKLRAEGQADQAIGKVKEAARQAVSGAKVAAATAIAKTEQAAHEAIEKAKNLTSKLHD